MNKIDKYIESLNVLPIGKIDDDQALVLEYFADQVDNRIQKHLISELMTKYTEVSKQLEENNILLNKYNNQLEELVQEKVSEITTSQTATIHALVKSAESRDDDTGAHIERTAMYCRFIAVKLHEANMHEHIVDRDYINDIEKAAPLHDIGKVAIKDAILLKPGKLTDDEYAMMKSHVIKGYNTLASVAGLYSRNKFLNLGMEISRYHHEKWDGSGYGEGLSGEDIPLSARIMTLADVYDALRSKRVYKEAFPHSKAVEIIRKGRGSHFDPDLVDIFLENHQQFCEIFDNLSKGN
ncbi:MAG: HD domain-containing protein [Oscillospiraceae bacterium]|nr:HD domain-containing protein [Oscillospiraceae bacterium]